MNRKNQRLVIEAFRRLRIAAEEGEAMTRALSVQDIGPTANERRAELDALMKHTEKLTTGASLLLQSLEDHRNASATLDLINYPRAKPLSSSKKKG